MDIDLIDVMIIITASVILGALLATGVSLLVENRRARRRNMQPLIGVVLPKENKK